MRLLKIPAALQKLHVITRVKTVYLGEFNPFRFFLVSVGPHWLSISVIHCFLTSNYYFILFLYIIAVFVQCQLCSEKIKIHCLNFSKYPTVACHKNNHLYFQLSLSLLIQLFWSGKNVLTMLLVKRK